jgi:hypothetical protein
MGSWSCASWRTSARTRAWWRRCPIRRRTPSRCTPRSGCARRATRWGPPGAGANAPGAAGLPGASQWLCMLRSRPGPGDPGCELPGANLYPGLERGAERTWEAARCCPVPYLDPRPRFARARVALAQRAEAAAAPAMLTITLTRTPPRTRAGHARAAHAGQGDRVRPAVRQGPRRAGGRPGLRAGAGRAAHGVLPRLPARAGARAPYRRPPCGPHGGTTSSCMAVPSPSGVTRGNSALIPLFQMKVAADVLGCDRLLTDWAGTA